MLKSIAQNHGLPAPLACYRIDCKSIIRPMKITFANKEDRDQFLIGFNKFKKSEHAINSISPPPRIRRDLMPDELLKLHFFCSQSMETCLHHPRPKERESR
ncbi:THAP-type domain-containing protein [Caenorhabditis elegans]|uniref:THAP-type domain-containing protein n=1 Tax=Caenorhabditis elegans TaxID=6239 RepID=G2HJZ4_CAEEL|nr:THAP-type domain-containing protein [Caenorhabditis elegans]CCD31144.1 THAP-type domain-containing protein [Caenorhabditis elegans]|eukprot:NP_001251557.1 Uncharacterized protein CELE_Y52B11A.19 [Caenorhabditis elegans]